MLLMEGHWLEGANKGNRHHPGPRSRMSRPGGTAPCPPPLQPPGAGWSEEPELGHCVWPGFIPGPVQEPLKVLPLAVPRQRPGARPGMAGRMSLKDIPGWPYLLGRRGTFDVEWVVGLLLLPGFSTLWEQELRPVNAWDMNLVPSQLWGPALGASPVGLGPQGD